MLLIIQTEMTSVVEVEKTAASVKLVLIDDGVGIFAKIAKSIWIAG